ncbi:MAG TPA: alpha/beta hydrolase [Dehalococcoidia bacterium]
MSDLIPGWLRAMPSVDVNGIEIHYECHGDDGPTLIVAHGLMGSIELTSRFENDPAALAAKGLRVIAYDARGHGKSGYTTNRADYTWTALGEDLYGLIRALGIDRASVYGGSMGAGTALALALNHPDVVEKLILRAPPPFGEHRKDAQRTFGALSLLYQTLGTRLTSRIVTMMPDMKRAQIANPKNDLRSFFGAQRRASIVPAIRGALFDEDLPVQRAGEVEQPTLILTHPDDQIHPLATGEALHERMPHAKLAVAPSATYWQDNADALVHVVTAFVKGETIARGLPEKTLHQH